MKKIAVVGPVGSGKTTMLDAMVMVGSGAANEIGPNEIDYFGVDLILNGWNIRYSQQQAAGIVELNGAAAMAQENNELGHINRDQALLHIGNDLVELYTQDPGRYRLGTPQDIIRKIITNWTYRNERVDLETLDIAGRFMWIALYAPNMLHNAEDPKGAIEEVNIQLEEQAGDLDLDVATPIINRFLTELSDADAILLLVPVTIRDSHVWKLQYATVLDNIFSFCYHQGKKLYIALTKSDILIPDLLINDVHDMLNGNNAHANYSPAYRYMRGANGLNLQGGRVHEQRLIDEKLFSKNAVYFTFPVAIGPDGRPMNNNGEPVIYFVKELLATIIESMMDGDQE